MGTTDTVKVFIENKDIPWEEVGNGVRRKIMTYDDNIMLVIAEFDKGGIGTVHHHYHSQITHVHSGKFDVEINGQRKLLSTGDVFYVPPHAPHGAVCVEAGTLIDVFSPMREDFIGNGNGRG
jgi:quercetin dioxygenase-like cupin family protein